MFITSCSDTKDYKSYTLWHKTKTNKATGQTRYALKSLESQLSNAHRVGPVALLVFVLCQIVCDSILFGVRTWCYKNNLN